MNPLKKLGLEAYLFATQPWRRRCVARMRAEGKLPLCVLFYHRIADTHSNDWTMGTQQFDRQLRWMQSHVDLVSLAEIQRRVDDGNHQKVAAHITFDDGYAENCDFAIPTLIQRNIPCTYFVSLDFILSGRAFPHDEAAGVPLPPNTIDQIRQLADAGIEIGAHTRHHADLGKVTDAETLVDELMTATNELGQLIDRPIRYFAFPFGKPENLNADAFDMAKEMGLSAVCSAYGAYNFPGQDPFHIQRIHGDPDFIRLKNWLTIDPRKTSRGRDVLIPRPAMSEKAVW